MKTEDAFLQAAIKKFKAQKNLGDKAFDQLEEKDFLFKPSAECNSIAIIVQHMQGNMFSRWTNFLHEDGEKSWRKRDEEFENILNSKESVVSAWNAGWDCVFDALASLSANDVMKTITIRSEPHLIIDAIIRQIDHYGYHVGQIVYIARLIKNEAWQSLSIPKNKSADYNQSMNHK